MKNLIYIGVLTLGLVSCNQPGDNDDVVKEPSRDGAIETVINVKHDVNYDVLTTTNTVWVKNRIDTVITKNDTLKSLGSMVTEGDEDDDGNIPKVVVPKNYELYITVK